MTRYSSTMTEALQEVREGFSSKQIKMAIGIASDKRYAGGNMTGAVKAIEKIKRGLSDHPQVRAVLKRQNEDLEEGLDLDELKMDDPKLVRKFDKLKRGDTVKLKTSSTISKGTDFIDYVVKAKNTVNKGRVEKITLVTKGNEKAVKKFLYKRDGKVTFAIGDMGASIDDIKEGVELQEKVDKKLALKILSMMKNQKFVKVSGDFVPEIYLSGMDRDALKKEFGRLPRGLPNASNGVPVVDFINYALGLDNEIDTEDGDKPQPKLYDYRTGKVIGKPKTVGDAAKMAGLRLEEVELEEKLGKDADAGDYIDDFKKSDAPQFKGKSDKKKRDMAIAAYLDAKDKKEEVEVDERKFEPAKSATGYDIFHRDFSSAMQHATAFAKKKGQPIKKDEIDNKVATGPRKPGPGKENSYTLETEKGKMWSVQVYNMGSKFELNMYLISSHVPEGDMLDEAVKYQFVAIDRLGKVIGFASDEKDAKDMARRGHTMDSPSKGKGVAGRNKAKVVKLKKPMSDKQGDMMINRDFDMNKFGGETTYSIGLKEGTWHIPDSPKLKSGLKKLMSKPIKLGKDGDDATDRIGHFIGDDELYDALFVAGKKNPNGDARDVIKKAMKRLGIKEEDEKKPDKPDSAKAVDQARDDKKKTRIAQLQLQIAKASEMINKLNSQEKPDA